MRKFLTAAVIAAAVSAVQLFPSSANAQLSGEKPAAPAKAADSNVPVKVWCCFRAAWVISNTLGR